MSKDTKNDVEKLIGLYNEPEKKLEILRKTIFTNDLYNSSVCIDKYFELFDCSEKGYNNYADDILSDIKNLNNVSHTWKSGIDIKQLIAEDDNTRNGTSNKLRAPIQISDEIRQNIILLNSPSIVTQNNTKSDEMITQTPKTKFLFRSIDNENQSPVSFGQSENSDNHTAKLNFKSVDNHNRSSLSFGQSETSDNNHTAKYGFQNRENKRSPMVMPTIVKSEIFSDKKNEINPLDKNRDPNQLGFRTASEQLGINIRKSNSNTSPHVAALYGSNKRSLGTRKGVWGDFIVPIPGNKTELNTKEESPSLVGSASVKGMSNGNNKYESIISHESLKQFAPSMIESLLNEIMDSGKNVTWDDIAGLESPKKILNEIVILPALRPDLFTGIREPAKGILLFGPPGTGKTLIGKCVASQSNSTFFSVSASSLTSKWVGEGEKMVRIMFTVARLCQPAVIFIDEIDSLLSQRNETEHESSRKIKTEFLVQMDGVGTGENERLLLLGATNRPQEIDEAARRRFVKRIYIPLPTRSARQKIMENILASENHSISSDQLDSIVDQCENYSGADVTNLCKEAAMGPIRNVPHEQLTKIYLKDVPPISYEDFLEALRNVKSSVSVKDLQQYMTWNELYGSTVKIK